MLYIQHILLNTPSISSIYQGTSSTFHGGQLATWSTLCVVNSP
ncbi:hypothetical protein T06_10406 [Trichinella sp. T6]|nr:hypothetical protein T06_10406 [Trichinella sp. T6]